MNEERLPPHDVDAEEAVIGSLLLDGASVYRVADFLKPADFYYPQNLTKYIFSSMSCPLITVFTHRA